MSVQSTGKEGDDEMLPSRDIVSHWSALPDLNRLPAISNSLHALQLVVCFKSMLPLHPICSLPSVG